MTNLVKQKMSIGEVPVGCFMSFYSPDLVEMIGYAGFDFVVIDNEHGPFSWREVEEMIRACEVSGLTPIVRVSSSNHIDILKALDRGAMGIHVPQVKDKREVENIIKATKYPPEGHRGVAYSIRAAKHGFSNGQEYLVKSNEDIFIAIHIENPTSVENLDDIMQMGVDVCYIGPTDLSTSYGKTANGSKDSQIKKLIEQIKKTGERLDQPIGIHVSSLEDLKQRKKWGAKYIGISVNTIINPSLAAYVDE